MPPFGIPAADTRSCPSYEIVMVLSNRRCRTLCAVFEEPTRADIRWNELVGLCTALGALQSKGGRSGSRRRFLLRGTRAVLHEPHPGSEMNKGSVESARQFLRNAGISPAAEGCRC